MKYVKLVLLILIVGVLAGCSASTSGQETNNLAYKQGAKSVSIKFQPNTPPALLFDEEEYDIGIELRNIGAYPGDDEDLNVDLYFIGFDENILGIDTEGSIDIPGSASPNDETFDVELFDEVSVLDQDIRVVACYEYETFQQMEICVDPNPVDNDEDSCFQGVLAGTGGQGAPVGVTSATVDSSRGKVRITLTVANLEGSGSVFRDDECLNPKESDKNVVEVIEVLLGDESMDCTPDEYLRIGGGSGRLTCTLDGLDEDRPSYKTTLTANFAYNFKKSIERTVRVERIE